MRGGLRKRTETSAGRFMAKLAAATHPGKRFQLTTDGLAAYRYAVGMHLGNRVDYAQLIKVYAQTAEGERRYSPPEVVSSESKAVSGPRHATDLHVAYRASERKLAAVVQAAHPADIRVLQEVGEFEGGACAALCLLQFLPALNLLFDG